MSLSIENITDENMAWDEYSVIDNMEVFTVDVDDDGWATVYDENGKRVKNPVQVSKLTEAIYNFRRGEK